MFRSKIRMFERSVFKEKIVYFKKNISICLFLLEKYYICIVFNNKKKANNENIVRYIFLFLLLLLL